MGALNETSDIYVFTGEPAGTNGIAFYSVEFSPPSLSADYNKDGMVDAADYVAWRKTNSGSANGYTDWSTNFGASFGEATRSSTVPEPSAIAMLAVVVLLISARCRV